jgi:hypothetical protein
MSTRNSTQTPTAPLRALLAILGLTLAATLGTSDANAQRPDFNGDGIGDLAIGAPQEDVLVTLSGVRAEAGVVHVIYGSAAGLNALGDQVWKQTGSPDLEETSEDGDHFGAALAWGDFNGDGCDDLAIGVPDESIAGHPELTAGGVNVLYGCGPEGFGLTAVGNQAFNHATSGTPIGADIRFGAALAAGDFNEDGYADLAVGSPKSDQMATDAGAVTIIYGSEGGLNSGSQPLVLYQGNNLPDASEAGDLMGSVLAAGDVNNDGRDELAIGIPGEDLPGLNAPGAAILWSLSGNQFLTQNAGLANGAEQADAFGSSLAMGDFNHDGRDDLAVGAPKEDWDGKVDAGVVNVFSATPTGTLGTLYATWSQNSTNIAGTAAASDLFGSDLAAGDFDNDGFADLAVGVPGDKVSGLAKAGAVHVLYGAAGGPNATGSQLWHQDKPNVLQAAQANDGFGSALSVGDFNADGRDDLAVGVPNETVNGLAKAGAVSVIYGKGANGLGAGGNQLWTQDSPEIEEVAEDSDGFGGGL